jgi:hypothetical protein
LCTCCKLNQVKRLVYLAEPNKDIEIVI